MRANWVIDGQKLLLVPEEGSAIVPAAADVISLIKGERDRLSAEYPEDMVMVSPAEELPDIYFSKIGTRIILEIHDGEEDQGIVISCAVRRKQRLYPIEMAANHFAEHVVIDHTWLYLTDNCEEVRELFKAAGTGETGKFTLAQYIRFIREAQKHPDIEILDYVGKRLAEHSAETGSGQMPVSLTASLYPYQSQGFRWLDFIVGEGCGCILGDEMGLGKTLQIIALIAARREKGNKPSLVIAPVSLLENWKREFEKFTRGLSVFIHHGPGRTGLYTDLQNYDAVIISYHTASADQSLLKMIPWDLLVLDEAQNIKNPDAIRTKAVKNIPRNAGIAVTGTPFENHISDLWSLMDFIVPGCLGSRLDFEKEITDDLEGAEKLEPVITPVMLRRRVSEVAQDLPERIDITQVLSLTEREAETYEKERKNILNSFDGKNAALPMLQKLRMFCTHPSLVEDDYPLDPVLSSSKYERLCELLEEINEMEEKVILFTSYNRMFEILASDIPRRLGIPVYAVNGSTPQQERQKIIDRFSGLEGTALLVLNPRAAGTGLNITAASRVIHYNLEWNPALEDQASARTYRRGQKKKVFVYRLYYKNTVEEVMNERIGQKREMFRTAVVGTDGTKENSLDILRALMMSPEGEKEHG